jgi:hypothetical protein
MYKLRNSQLKVTSNFIESFRMTVAIWQPYCDIYPKTLNKIWCYPKINISQFKHGTSICSIKKCLKFSRKFSTFCPSPCVINLLKVVMIQLSFIVGCSQTGNPFRRGRLSTLDLLIYPLIGKSYFQSKKRLI